MKNNFETIYLNKIKLNIGNSGLWVVPEITRLFTPKRSNFLVKKANNFSEIYHNKNLCVGNYYISLNHDYDFKIFNTIQKFSALANLEINSKVIQQIEKHGYWIYRYNPEINLKFVEKTIFKIYKGNAFLINENYFENYVEILKSKGINLSLWTFIWNGKKFELEY